MTTLHHLWAPWRSAYVQNARQLAQGECLFCVLARSQTPREHHRLLLTERCLVALNLYPYATGHLLVAPRGHWASPTEADPASLAEIQELVVHAERALRQVYRPDGLNVGMNLGEAAGAGVPSHFHVHVVPRWTGDTNFMAALAATRVHPEALGTTMDKLEPYFVQGPLPGDHPIWRGPRPPQEAP